MTDPLPSFLFQYSSPICERPAFDYHRERGQLSMAGGAKAAGELDKSTHLLQSVNV